MGAPFKPYTQNPVIGQTEVFDKYQRALQSLACRVLGEPYNFRAIDEHLTPAMCGGDYFGEVLAEAQKQFRATGHYSPQSISMATGQDVTALLNWAQADSELDTMTAWAMFEHIYGQWVEIQAADLVRAQIGNGSSSEEIRINTDKFRKEKGLTAKVIINDGKGDFERELINAIDCKPTVYAVRPPLESLRQSIPYFEPGEYAVVAARTGMGKSYFALNCNYQCAKDNVPSCYINLENTPKNVQRRIWQMHTGVKWQPQYPGITQVQVGKMMEGWEWVKKCNIESYTPQRNLNAVLNTIRRDYYERGCQLAVVDYLQKIREGSFRGNRVDELAEISAELRQLANDLKIPIIVLAQINREAEKSADKRPSMADIRGSGDIEQDASTVLLLYRPGYYQIENDENALPYPENYADIYRAKGRDSGPGLVKCRFNEVFGFYDEDLFSGSTQFPNQSQPGPATSPVPRGGYDAPF
jgi:hypothetical protein